MDLAESTATFLLSGVCCTIEWFGLEGTLKLI